MPALPADIGPAMRAATTVTWEAAAIKARYPSARDGSLSPAAGYCDSAADAQALINARGALIGVERHRYEATVFDVQWPDPTIGLPARSVIDSDQAVNAVVAVARIAVNLEEEVTREELWG